MEWNMMEPYGSTYSLGYNLEDLYVPYDDCEDTMEEMTEDLLHENQKTFDVRRRMSLEKVVEKDLVPLLKVCQNEGMFAKAVRLMANLTQPSDMSMQPAAPVSDVYGKEISDFIDSAKHQCSDIDFLKALSTNMREILKKEPLEPADIQCLNYCIILLRNLFHVRPGTSPTDQASLAHQCLISSFFINELDKVIYNMLNHKHKETWTIGMTQLISFLFKDFSSSLLEPDVDDNTSTSSSEDNQDVVEIVSTGTPDQTAHGNTDRNLSSNFKSKLQIRSPSDNTSEDDDFMLEFNSTSDGRLEIKLTNCPQRTDASGSCEDMDIGERPSKESKRSPKHKRGGHSSPSSGISCKDADGQAEGVFHMAPSEKEVLSSINQSSCLMDMDIIVSYLKKFATDIMYSGFVDLVENIMKALLTKYDNILDHSFLMWTVGFFLSLSHQQELDFSHFKEVLNLDLFGFLVYEGVKCCETLEVKHRQKQDLSVEKHRLHLVVCTLNQMFRTLLANSKMEYLINLQKCMSHMTDLRNSFILLIRRHLMDEQSEVYLRDLVQTNHVLMLMIEEWMSHDFIGEHCGFSMINHVKQFATKNIMAKYGSLLEHQDLGKETVNVAVLTMMYHVVGDCKRQDTLMQLPILKSFSEIWVENAVREQEEFKDLIEFVLEVFMSDAEKDPNLCAQNLFDGSDNQQQAPGRNRNTSSSGAGSCSGDADSSMNISSSCSSEEFSDEEQVLVFTWMSELTGAVGVENIITRKLKEHGFLKTKEQVSKYLVESGFLDEMSPSPTCCIQSRLSNQPSKKNGFNVQDNSNILHELSYVSEDRLIPFLLDKLRTLGFEPHLVWLQKQLLEAAYVKLGIKDPSYRIHVEEPVAKFYALQNKPIPMIPWNDDLDEALANPYFHLLQQSLGLYTNDDPSIVYPRIPQYLTPTLLVNKARQIGSIDSVPVKFNVDTFKESTDHDTCSYDPPVKSMCRNMEIYKPLKTLSHTWLNVIQKMNGDVTVGSS
ncbi:hypothetical protein BsWGS_03660 [Bradybaena similaris]